MVVTVRVPARQPTTPDGPAPPAGHTQQTSTYFPAASDIPFMRLEISSLVGAKIELGGITSRRIPQVFGDPPVFCDLDEVQADHIWQHGVPESLIDALITAAHDANWRPLPPGGGSYTQPPVEVDPTGHFNRDARDD